MLSTHLAARASIMRCLDSRRFELLKEVWILVVFANASQNAAALIIESVEILFRKNVREREHRAWVMRLHWNHFLPGPVVYWLGHHPLKVEKGVRLFSGLFRF